MAYLSDDLPTECVIYSYVGGRGLAHGFVFVSDGTHVATVVQETLVRVSNKNTAK